MITIFENIKKDEFYIKIEINEKDSIVEYLNGFSVLSVSLIETMTSSSTYLNIKFIDVFGELINKYPFIPDSDFVVTYGKTKESSKLAKFKLSNIKYSLMSESDASGILVIADLIHHNWEKLFKYTYSRSWENVNYSDVVEDIANECLFDDYEIEQTKNEYNVIQPMWSNALFLKWLAKNSVNKYNIGGFVYYITLDDKFVFSTFDNLYNNEPKEKLAHISTNFDGEGFFAFNITNNYMPTLVQGGFGIKYSYFDFETKQYVNEEKTLTDINERQLSDWYYIAEGQVEPAKDFYGGRNVDFQNVIQNRILTTANSVQRVDLHIKGRNDLSIGDVVNIYVPITKQIKRDEVINETYSGYWLIWKVVHKFNMEDNNYATHLFLARNGINGKSISGLVKTKTGKQLK